MHDGLEHGTERAAVDGTVVRVLDSGCRETGRPWRALVQDRAVDNIIHITLDRASDLREGDSIAFDGRVVCPFSAVRVGKLNLDMPRQITMDEADAKARLSFLRSARTLEVSTSDGGPALGIEREEPGQGVMQVIHRPRRGADPAVNWVVERFSERGAAERRGPVIILDPALCSSGHAPSAMPFITLGSIKYLEVSSSTGRAGVKMLLDTPHHPRPRWWGVVMPLSLVHDPLEEWRGCVGKYSGLLPRAMQSFDTTLRLSLAHEMAHVIQHAYGVPRADGASAAAECFADSASILLYLLDGGSADEARLYAHQRAASALMFPGNYSTGEACHAAIAEARKLMKNGTRVTTHEILLSAAKISRERQPPAKDELVDAEKALPRGGSWDKVEWSGLKDWLLALPDHIRGTFELAVEGVHACALPRGHGHEAANVVMQAWDSMSHRLGQVGMQSLRVELQARLDTSCQTMLEKDTQPDDKIMALALLGHRVNSTGPDRKARIRSHVVASSEPDSMEQFWSLTPSARIEAMRTARVEASEGNEEAVIRMGEAAMSLMLDARVRLELDDEDYDEAAAAWAASLPDGRTLLASTYVMDCQP